MKIVNQLICPISKELVNEKVTRTNALFTILLVIASFALNSLVPFLLLLADFYIRVFSKLKNSPLGYLSKTLVNVLGIAGKKIDKAPKIFAARLGFVMTLLMAILFIFGQTTGAKVVGIVLVLFAFLEFAFAFCMGCYIYTYIILKLFREK